MGWPGDGSEDGEEGVGQDAVAQVRSSRRARVDVVNALIWCLEGMVGVVRVEGGGDEEGGAGSVEVVGWEGVEGFGFFFSGLDVCLRVFNGGVVRLSREFGGEWFFLL